MSAKGKITVLCCLSAVLLSVPFLVPHTGAVALVALVPLLCADRISRCGDAGVRDGSSENCAGRPGVRHFYLYAALCFFLWNLAATFWVCNATIGGGITAFIYNTFWMTLIFSAYRFSRRWLGGVLPYIFLASLWVCMEKLYFAAQISWPWLTLGNAFARTTSLCQWYEYTGTLGGSLWIWAVNLGIFALMCGFSDGILRTRRQIVAAVGTVALAIAGPVSLSLGLYAREGHMVSDSGNVSSTCAGSNVSQSVGSLPVIIVQPNIDPYNKFEFLSQPQQDSIAVNLLCSALVPPQCSSQAPSGGMVPLQCSAQAPSGGTADSTMLVLLPETFTAGLSLQSPDSNSTIATFASLLDGYPDATVLLGATSYGYFLSHKAPSYTARKVGRNIWCETHNSAVTVTRRGTGDIYHKNKLVVGVELMPYPKLFSKIDKMLGGVMGRCIGDGEATALNVFRPTDVNLDSAVSGDSVKVGCAICYESVYGDFCRGYVNDGAEVMTIITNDAWWKNTPGYRQHLSYARLRAIELRRDVARCANTGTSAFINRRGDVLQATPWWESAVISGTVKLYADKTVFVRYGDIPGRIATFMTCLLAVLILVNILTKFRSGAGNHSGRCR